MMMSSSSDESESSPPADSNSHDMIKIPGTIVRISGLKSELGQCMNDKLGQVLSVHKETGRIQVIMTLDRKIKMAAVKAENLAVHLTEQDAVRMCVKTGHKMKEKMRESDVLERRGQALKANERLPNMSPADIVQGLCESNWAIFQAFNLPGNEHPHGLDSGTIVKIFEQGLIEACLDKFHFPDAIDDNTNDKHAQVMCLAPDTLNQSLTILFAKDRSAFHRWGHEMVQQMGPIIMTVCTPKRRLYNVTDGWYALQYPFLRLLRNSVCTGGSTRIEFFLNNMDTVVLKAMAQHLVTCMTVDLRIFLDCISMQIDNPWVMEDSGSIKVLVLQIVAELMCISNLESFAVIVGQVAAPEEAVGMAGRNFAECFVDCAASFIVLKQHPGYEKGAVVYNLRHIYQKFLGCRKLRPILGLLDHKFLSLKSNADFERWAEARSTEED